MPRKRPPKLKQQFLAVSDVHLHDHIWADRKDIKQDPFVAFSQVIQIAIEQGLPIVAAGDLIDINRPSSRVMTYLAEQMWLLERNEIPFYFIQGQHEFADPPWFDISDHPTHLDADPGRVYEIGSWRIWGLDYRPPAKLKEALEEIPKDANCLVCHQVWEEFMGNIRARDGSFVQIPSNIELVITGDLHKHRYEMYHGKEGHEFHVLSPGATHRRTIREPDEHFCFGIYAKPEDGIKQYKLISRPAIRWEQILHEDALENFVVNIQSHLVGRSEECEIEEISKPLVYVPYSAAVDGAYRRIKAAIGSEGYFFPKELQPPQESEVIELTEENRIAIEEDPLLGALSVAVDAEEEPEVFDALVRLARCVDVKQELLTIKGEHLDAS